MSEIFSPADYFFLFFVPEFVKNAGNDLYHYKYCTAFTFGPHNSYMMEKELSIEFINQSIFRMDENTHRIHLCLEALPEEAIWQRPNASSNSIGNLILHLCGNIGQYAVSSLSGRADARQRDAEFAATAGPGKLALLERLTETVEDAKACIKLLDATELLRMRMVQGFQLSGMGIIIHVTEHYSYHTGQIAFWTKYLQDRDLGFYAGIDLNVKNS